MNMLHTLQHVGTCRMLHTLQQLVACYCWSLCINISGKAGRQVGVQILVLLFRHSAHLFISVKWLEASIRSPSTILQRWNSQPVPKETCCSWPQLISSTHYQLLAFLTQFHMQISCTMHFVCDLANLFSETEKAFKVPRHFLSANFS